MASLSSGKLPIMVGLFWHLHRWNGNRYTGEYSGGKMHGRGKLTLVPSNKFSLLYLSGEIHKGYTSEENLLCLKVPLSVLTVLKLTPQICCIPRFRSTCYPCGPINLCSRQRDIMAQIRCMAVSVFFSRKNCQATNRKSTKNSEA